jgi:Cu(I)/Ag(I) efflux system membrane protein CusA/SilA
LETAFSVNARYAQEYRNSIEDLKNCRYKPWNSPIPLDAVADIKISDGPPMINSVPCMWESVLFNVRIVI